VGTASSALSKFLNPANESSAHFVVDTDKIYCLVDTDNTAYTNANWASNLESVTIEHAGDWRNGYRNEGVINQSAILVAWLRSLYPNATPQRHREVAATACPGDLPVEEIWNKATAILNPPKPAPAPVPPATPIQITDIANRVVVTKKDANLWDLNFNTWAEAKSVKVIPKGTEVEISAVAKHPLGSSYYMTEYSFSKGIKNGINVVDCEEKPPVVEPPIVVPPVDPPVTPPIEPPVEPTYPNWFVEFWLKLIEAIKNILGRK
jgi:N-acetylmuramoyl-L-alanine amidase CwlA